MHRRHCLGLVFVAAVACTSADEGDMQAEQEQLAAEGLHRRDAGDSCQRTYVVWKDKRVAQTPRDDAELIDTLVPHHEAAVEMANMEIERGDNADVKAMAETMKTTQSGEIEKLRALREKLTGCTDGPVLRDPHMKQDMEKMMAVSGGELDRLFLEEMIPHHASALSFTHNALPNLSDPELQTMAKEIIDAQSMEVGHMHMKLMELAQM